MNTVSAMPPSHANNGSISSNSLNQPVYDSVLAIDDRLKQLELEAKQMEQKYAFIKSQHQQVQKDFEPQPQKTENVQDGYDPHKSNFLAGIQSQNGQTKDSIVQYSNQLRNETKMKYADQKESHQFESLYAREILGSQSALSSNTNQVRYQNLPSLNQREIIEVGSGSQFNYDASVYGNQQKTVNFQDGELEPIREIVSAKPGSVMIMPGQKIVGKSVVNMKPQISKEYQATQQVARPDFQILSDNYEKGDKFYEPQYSIIGNRKPVHQISNRPSQCIDEQINKADVQFRETESQITHQKAVFQKIQHEQSEDFYDSFM